MSTQKQNTGYRGEEVARCYLIRKQYKILVQNWHSRFGEVDIIAQKNGRLVFIEVKTRRSYSKGYGVEAVTKKKLRKISIAGIDFIHKRCPDCAGFCIEVIEISYYGNRARLRHYKDVQI